MSVSASDPEPPLFNECDRSGWPFVVVVFLVLAVWMSALLPHNTLSRLFGIGHTNPEPRVITGSAPDLAGAIRRAPKAIVYVDEPTSTYSAVGRIKFLDAAKQFTRNRKLRRVQFFVVEQQYAPETRVWMDSLGDDRLEFLGRRMKGYGGVIWLEFGRVVEADDAVGRPNTDPEVEARSLALWSSEP